MNLKNILQTVAGGIALLILTGIWYNTKDVPDLKEKVKTQAEDEWNRYVELNTKVYNLEKKIERQRLIDSINEAHK